jgi:GAF domain-containing protein
MANLDPSGLDHSSSAGGERRNLPAEIVDAQRRVDLLLSTGPAMCTHLESLAVAAVQRVDAAESVGITLLVGRTPTPLAISDDLALRAELTQYEAGEGPGLVAIETGAPIGVEDLESDGSFPHFAPGAVASGVRAVVAVPLTTEHDIVGAIDFYSSKPRAFDDGAEKRAGEVAGAISAYLRVSPLFATTVERVENLADGDTVQAEVFQACEWLMAQQDIDLAHAFGQLRQVALDEGASIAAVAGRLPTGNAMSA